MGGKLWPQTFDVVKQRQTGAESESDYAITDSIAQAQKPSTRYAAQVAIVGALLWAIPTPSRPPTPWSSSRSRTASASIAFCRTFWNSRVLNYPRRARCAANNSGANRQLELSGLDFPQKVAYTWLYAGCSALAINGRNVMGVFKIS